MEISYTSNTTEAGPQAKGKMSALEVQGSMSPGNGGSDPVRTTGKKARKLFTLGQNVEVLELLNKGTKHMDILLDAMLVLEGLCPQWLRRLTT